VPENAQTPTSRVHAVLGGISPFIKIEAESFSDKDPTMKLHMIVYYITLQQSQ
jgi:hypothetical protein